MSRIQKLQERLNKSLDAIEELADKVEVEERDFDEDEQKTFDQLKQDIEEIKGMIEREKEIEELAKSRAVPVQTDSKPEQMFSGGTPNKPKKGLKAQLLVDMAKAMYHGGGQHWAALQYCEMRGFKEAAAVLKAVTNPADTTTAGWAAELMNETMAAFIELLRPASVYARSPGRTAVLGRNGKVLFPGLTTGVSGGWVGEGQPIPVQQGVFNRQELPPSKLGVITVQTRELLERSDPSSDAIIRDAMVNDTAIVLDTTFVSADAAVAGVSPAGIRNGVTPIDGTPAGATNTILEMDTLFAAMVSACLGLNMNSDLYWIMSPVNRLKLGMMSTAAGNYPYKDQLDSGRLLGYPVLDSNTQGDTEITLVHGSSLYKLQEGSIEMAMSTDATLHFNTAPEQIVGGGGTPSIPSEGNVRSVFQEDSVALRLIMPAAWLVVRSGAVQVGNNFVL